MEGGGKESELRTERLRADGGQQHREGGTATETRPEQRSGTRGPEGETESSRGISDRLRGMVSSAFGEPADETAAPLSPTELPDAALLGHRGSFCEQTFERETGYTVDEFVVEYVAEHGGAVRQQAIVGCLPWSASKVSRLLGDLEAEERLVRKSMGRENAVFLPEAVPERS